MSGNVTDSSQPELFDLYDINECITENNLIKLEKEKQKQREIEESRKLLNKKKGLEVINNRKLITGLPYYDNPVTDNDRLINYQYDWLINGNKESWDKLFVLSYSIIKNLIKSYTRDKHKYLDKSEQAEKASEAALYVFRRFDAEYITTLGPKEKNNFLKKFPLGQYYVTTNFIEFLRGGVIHAFNYKTELDRNTISLEELSENEKRKGYN